MVMKLVFGSKALRYDIAGEPAFTDVILRNDEGALYPVSLDASFINKTSDELYKICMEKIYEANYADKASQEKLEKFDQVESKVNKNKEIVDKVTEVTNALISIATYQQEYLGTDLYNKISKLVEPIQNGKTYLPGDIVTVPYPYSTISKWPKGTNTILRFQGDKWTQKNQTVESLLQSNAWYLVMPKLN